MNEDNGTTRQADLNWRRANNGAALLVSVAEAAKLLGISHNLAYDLVREGRLPHINLGRRILVPRRGLEDWIAREAGVAALDGAMVSLPQRTMEH